MVSRISPKRRRIRRKLPAPNQAQEKIDLLTPRELAAKLGWTDNEAGERLKRAVFAAERRLGKEIFVREGTAARQSYKGTIPALRKWIPQLFDRSKLDDVTSNLREYVDRLEVRVDSLVADKFAEDVEPRIRQLRSEVEAVRKGLNALDGRVKALESARGADPSASTDRILVAKSKL